MSIDVSRSYLIRIDKLPQAFAALAEIAPRWRTPREYPIQLPDGSSVVFPFAPDADRPPYVLKAGSMGSLSFDYAFRVGGGDDMVEYVRRNPEPPFQVKRSKWGGIRATVYLWLLVYAEPPYADVSFHNANKDDCDVFGLRSVCDVLDYVGQCAESLVTYETVMGEDRLIEPFEEALPKMADEDGVSNLARIVEYVQEQIGRRT